MRPTPRVREEVSMPTRSFIAVVFVFALSVTPMTFEAKQAKNPGPSEHKLKKEVAAFAPLQGQWSCAGVFPSNGKKIESKIAFVADLDGAGLVKRHDDLPPNVFHDADYWGFDSAAKQSSRTSTTTSAASANSRPRAGPTANLSGSANPPNPTRSDSNASSTSATAPPKWK